MNRFDQIIGVEGYNEDGQELAASLDVLYKDYESALSEVLEAQWMQDYLCLLYTSFSGSETAAYR